MTGKTFQMLQTCQKDFRILPKCHKLPQNVSKCPLQTHRCPNGLDSHRMTSSRKYYTSSSKDQMTLKDQERLSRLFLQKMLLLEYGRRKENGASKNGIKNTSKIGIKNTDDEIVQRDRKEYSAAPTDFW